MEGKKVFEEEAGQEINFEEEEDISIDEAETKAVSPRKNLRVLWTLVVLVFVAIIVGWVYFLRYNLQQIDEKIQNKNSVQNINEQFSETMSNLENVFQNAPGSFDELVKKQEAEKQKADEREKTANQLQELISNEIK